MLKQIKKFPIAWWRARLPLLTRLFIALVLGYVLAAGLSLLNNIWLGGEDRTGRTIIYFVFMLYYALAIITFMSINSLMKTFLYAIAANALVWLSWFYVTGVAV